jgi:hypothetical protein
MGNYILLQLNRSDQIGFRQSACQLLRFDHRQSEMDCWRVRLGSAMKKLAGRSFLTYCLLAVVLSLGLGSAPVSAGGPRGAAKSTSLRMTLKDGKLTAEIRIAPLHKVIEEISRLTGAEVRGLNQGGDEPVSVEFTDLSINEALERILKTNFTLSYTFSGRKRRLTEIWILSREHAPQVREVARAGLVGLNSVPADPDTEINLAEQPVSVRLEAVELLAMHADKDEAVRETLSHLAHSDRDPQVREMASRILNGMQ